MTIENVEPITDNDVEDTITQPDTSSVEAAVTVDELDNTQDKQQDIPTRSAFAESETASQDVNVMTRFNKALGGRN